jgi:hypothetical protein
LQRERQLAAWLVTVAKPIWEVVAKVQRLELEVLEQPTQVAAEVAPSMQHRWQQLPVALVVLAASF